MRANQPDYLELKREPTLSAKPLTRRLTGTEPSDYSDALLIADRITDAARRPNQLPLALFVNFVPEVAHVHVHDVRRPVGALVPDMLDDHCARDHAPGVGQMAY